MPSKIFLKDFTSEYIKYHKENFDHVLYEVETFLLRSSSARNWLTVN